MQYALVTLALTASTLALPTKREVIGNTLNTVTGTAGGVVGTATGATSGLGLRKRQEGLVDPALKTVDETLGGVTSTLGKRQNDVLTPVVDTAGGVVGTATGVVGSTGLTEGLLKRQEGLTESLPIVNDLKVDELTSGLKGLPVVGKRGLQDTVESVTSSADSTLDNVDVSSVGLKRGIDASNAVPDVSSTVGNLKVAETVGDTVSGLDLPTTVGSATKTAQGVQTDKTIEDLGVTKRDNIGNNVGEITDEVDVGETAQGATGAVGSTTKAIKDLNLNLSKRELDLGALVSSISSEQLDDILSKVDIDGLLEDLTDILSNVDISGILSSLTDDQLSTITDGLGLGSLL